MTAGGHTEGAPAGAGLPATPTADLPPAEPVGHGREATPEPARRTVEGLAAFVVEQAGRPIDVWAIAALLESAGTRDLDAVEHYGRRDVFALARAVEARLPAVPPPGPPEDPERPPLRARLRRFGRLFGRGAFFVVPLALQLISLLAVGVSQFASTDFTIRQASVVAMAAVASFVVTAAFVQASGFLAPLFEEPGKHRLTERVMWRLIGIGMAATLAVGGVLWAVAAATGAYGATETRIGLVYFLFVSVQSLAQAVLYTLRRFALMIVTTVLGIGVAIALYKGTGLAIQYVHWIGLAVAVGLELGGAAILLRRGAKATRGSMRLAEMPPARLLLRRCAPYAAYGVLYFLFISVDRLVAWADGDNPLFFWFRPEYELGLDAALGGVVLALAFLEIAVEGFSEMLAPASERYGLSRTADHNRAMTRFWSRQLAFVGALVAIGAWVAVGLAALLDRLGALGPAAAAFHDSATHWSFAGGLVGYAFLALGLTNSIFVMSLARTWVVVRIIAPALAVSVGVGIAITSHGPYYGAVGGMVAGAVLFALLSGVAAHRTLRRTDYWTYAAW